MRRTILGCAIFALAAVAATAAQAAPTLIYRIDRVSAAIIRNHLVVSAMGAVQSGGWVLPRLHLKEFHIPESDSEVVEFLATPPPAGSVVIQALLPIEATAVFPLPHYAVTQVKVLSQSNAVTAPIGSGPAARLAKPDR